MSGTPAPPSVATRERLVRGLASALAERRYVDVTMNDIVRHARTSKRTFYEHFADKEECFLELYARACDGLYAAQAARVDPSASMHDQIRVLTEVYLETLAADPAISRAILSDVIAGGDACLVVRRREQERYADAMRLYFEHARRAQPDAGIRSLSLESAAALVGAINELVLRAFDAGRADQLMALAPTIEGLLRSMVLDRR